MDREKQDAKIPAEETVNVTSILSFYDREELYYNCTVQVLTNTKTGEISYGWWRNDPDEEPEVTEFCDE